MRKTLLITIFLLSMSLVRGCILPDKIDFIHPMDVEMLKATNKNYQLLGEVVMIDYDNFVLTVEDSRATITCKEVLFDCLDNSTFRSVIEDLETWNAYDLSKEDKDTIAILYQPNVIIRKLENKGLLLLKFKGFIMRIVGKIFCVNYERVIECRGEWCSLEMLESESCPKLLSRCG